MRVVPHANGVLVQYPGSQRDSDKGNLCNAYSLDALQKLDLKPEVKYTKP